MANFITVLILFATVFGCCYGDKQCTILKDVNGCSTPIKSDKVPYRVLFTPACNSHDACYRCGRMYNWTQSDCDKGFLNKMRATCVDQPNQMSFNSFASTKGKMMSYLEFFKRLYDGYKKATANGTKAEAQRVWDECLKVLAVFRQWVKASPGVAKCRLGAQGYFHAVNAFGIYAYRHNHIKEFCKDKCAKDLANPF